MTDGDQDSKLAALEKALLDESTDPIDIPFSLLKSITGNFSQAQVIGSGGFGAVYKGVLPSGHTIAVKKLFEKFEILDKNFKSEVACLIGVKHKNTVRFLGHCSEAQHVMLPYEGKIVCAEQRQRLLCFEYLPKGCLADYLSDASCRLQWTTRYEIIKGICEGVHYLHQQRIIHMDLKPQNVLLDDNMVPRIADFGLSRRLSESKSRTITMNMIGTKGYMAPEFLIRGEITFKTDIYSLGVIIMEILTGCKDCYSVKEVVEIWRDVFGTSKSQTSLEQVKACAEIGIECTNRYPRSRPATWFIIRGILGETEISDGPVTRDISFASKLAGQLQLMDDSAAAPSQLPPSMLEVEQKDGKVSQERKRKTSNISFFNLADEQKLMDNSVAPSQLQASPLEVEQEDGKVGQQKKRRASTVTQKQKILISEHTRKLYNAVCRHAKKPPPIKDETIIIDFGSYFIFLYDLADSVEPEGKLSNSTCEIALHILKQEMLPQKKFVMPLRITQYLTEGSFNRKELKIIFKFSQSNHLDDSELIMFPRMLILPYDENCKNKHYYLIVLNLKAKRFEVLDSLKLETRLKTQRIMIEDCQKIVASIRNCWATKYSHSSTRIQDYPIEYVDAPLQENRFDCGYFMLKYIELWDGMNVAYLDQSDMPNIRMLYTEKWLNWVENKVEFQTLLSTESDSS